MNRKYLIWRTKIFKCLDEQSLRGLWGNIKVANWHVTGIPGDEERNREKWKNIWKIMVKIFPNLMKNITRLRSSTNCRKNTPKHKTNLDTPVKLLKTKERKSWKQEEKNYTSYTREQQTKQSVTQFPYKQWIPADMVWCIWSFQGKTIISQPRIL